MPQEDRAKSILLTFFDNDGIKSPHESFMILIIELMLLLCEQQPFVV
jgi:hypothetical protein